MSVGESVSKADDVHRLEDLLVEEVSIVDRPANKRRFLAIKNEGGMSKQVQVGDDGKLTASGDVPQPAAPQVDSVDKSEPVEKRLTITPELRAEIFRSMGDVVRRIHTVIGVADIAEVSEKDDSTLVPVMMSELKEISTAIGGTVKRLNAVAKSDSPDDGTQASDSDPVESALKQAVDAVEEAVSKRNIGKGRLSKFKQALGTLQAILNELEGPAKPAKQQSGADDPVVQAAAGAANGGVKKDDLGVAVSKSVERLGVYVESLVKTVEQQGRVIQQLRDARPASNALSVEKSEPVESVEPTWPLDMNADKSRESVDKSISFHK